MAVTTTQIVRDRSSSIISLLTPNALASDGFKESLAEYSGDIKAWARTNKQSCLRRFLVLEPEDEVEPGPVVSNVTTEQVVIALDTTVCYPHTHRYGDAGAIDRMKVIKSDFLQIDYAIGLYSRSNFPAGSAHDACWMGRDPEAYEHDNDAGVSFLILRNRYLIYRTRG